MKPVIRVAVFVFAVAVNLGAFYAIHVAMSQGEERARVATIEPQVIIVTAPKDGPVLAAQQYYP